ncbi:hypothetical protein Cadr_000028869 [Camelus dromedarius]|uniref:Uncharacterized protein n=1 Tax=Camelus dromedarius TaxID=9838 RepID=A0A5N4C714_CAMDR|nr:hypothetical protein Cadr_000028869 [Camelus dromedarius]
MAALYCSVSSSTCTSAQGSTGEHFQHCDAKVITTHLIPSDGLLYARTPWFTAKKPHLEARTVCNSESKMSIAA